MTAGKPKKPAKRNKTPKPRAVTGALVLERIPVAQIKPAAYNPRRALTPADPEYQRIRASIESFGYTDPLVWNRRTGNLVGGHQRLRILTDEFGASEIDVSVVDLDPLREKALNVALNNPAIGGSWDEIKLAATLGELRAAVSIDERLTGYDDAEIARLIDAAKIQTELKPLDTRRPPAMAWVLLGIPTTRFGEVSETVETLAAIEGAICETTVNDG